MAEALAAHAGGEHSDAAAQGLLQALGVQDMQDPAERPRSADLRVVAEALAEHGEHLTDAATKLLSSLGSQYDAVAAALATHVADVADDEQLELAADALVKHLLWIDVMDDVKVPEATVTEDLDFELQKIDVKTVAKVLLAHAAFAYSTENELEKGFTMRGEATPFRVSSNPVQLLKLHAALRAELTEGIRSSDPAQIRSAINRGASLSAHYYTARMPARTGSGVNGTSKGPKQSLVNPVDWAVLEGFYQEAIFLLELTDGKMAFNRDEECSTLQVVRMAQRCQQAVVVASTRGQVQLLRELLQRNASCIQREPISGCTALHLAARNGEEEVAAMLLERGAWEQEDHKEEVLMHAEAQRLQCIIEAAGLAARKENALDPKLPDFHEVIQVLSDVKEEDRNLTWAEIQERSSLAARARPSTLPGYVPEPTEILPWGPLPTVAEARREQKELLVALSKAIRKSDIISVRALVQRGAPMELTFDLGYGEKGNCVDWAVSCEKPNMALVLLEIADERNVGEALAQKSVPALFWSVLRGYMDVLEGLLRRGIDVAAHRHDVVPLSTTETALSLSITSARREEARLLLRYGAWQREAPAKRIELLKKVRMQGKQMIAVFAAEGVTLT